MIHQHKNAWLLVRKMVFLLILMTKTPQKSHQALQKRINYFDQTVY